MAEEIKKVISIDTNGADSVKDLIDKVEKLRGILKTLDETSDEYKTTLSELKSAQDSLSSSLGKNKTKAEAAEGSYNALAQQMKVLKKEWKATNDEVERNALGNEIKGINDQLKALDQSIGNNQRNVGNYAGSFQALRQEIKDARDVMAGAARGSEEYAAAAQKAAEASDKLRDMQMEIANGASGLDNKFSVMTNMLGSVSGGFAAVQGAMALFGAESENLQKTFVKLQAAMSMTQGFKALAELPKGFNAAKIAFGDATKGVKNFIKGLNGVKGAIAATGIGILLVLLGELIANWDAVTEAVSNFVGGMDGLTEKLAGVANVIKNFITGPIKALSLAFKGQFSEALDAFKDGFKISANYAEGVAKQATKNVQKNLKEQSEARAKDLDYQIRMNEAKKGSDFKYTEEGKKMYEELFKAKLAMYDKDSEEYKEILIQMEAYSREFTDHQKQEEERRAKEQKRRAKEQEEARKAAYERAKAIAEKEKEMYENASAAAGNAILSEFGKRRAELENKIKEFEPLITKAFGNPPFKELGESLVKEANATITAQEKKIREALEDAGLTYEGLMEVLKKGPKEAIPIYDEALRAGGQNLTKELYTIFDNSRAIITNLTESSWEEMDGIIKLYSEKAQESIKNNIINEGEWQLFIDAVRNIMTKALNDENKEIFDLAKTYNMTFDEIDKYHTIWAEGYSSKIGELRDETWRFTEEGQEFYKEYYDGLKKYYANDFVNWMKVLDDEAKYQRDLLKYQEDEKRKSLRRQLEDELAIIDERQKALERQNEDDYFAFAYGEGTWHQVGKFFGFIMEDSLKLYNNEIALNNEYLANFALGINAQIEELQKEKELETATAQEKMELERQIAALKVQLSDETYQIYAKNKDLELQKAKKIEGAKKTLASNTASIFGSLSDYMSTLSDRNAETNEESARKQFEASKALGITETIISTLASVQGIIKSFSGLGPWGIAAGAVAGAAALASGMARVAQIRNQKFDSSGGDSSSSVGITSAVAVPQLETTPYQYTSNVTNAADEAELNKPVIVQVSDVEDAMKVRESRSVETSF